MNTLSNPLSPTRARCMCDKHQVFEEPCESKDSRTVLETSAGGDTCTEFNQRQLKRKKRGSRKYRQLQHRIALHREYISNARKDFHFKTAHQLCNDAGTIFAEDLNLKAMSSGMLCKHARDAGFGQFLPILGHICFKRGKYFALVNANGTSQTCPQCQTHTGKKLLSEPIHKCPECGYERNRDVAAAQVVLQRGYTAVGHIAVKLGEGK